MAVSVFAADDIEGLLAGSGNTDKASHSLLSDIIQSQGGNVAASEVQVFLRAFEANNWDEALMKFRPAFGGKSFESNPNGIALKSYLYMKAGLQVTGLENLFQISQPKKIHYHILSLIRESAPQSASAWSVAQVRWNTDWSEIFGSATEARSKAFQETAQKSTQELIEISKKSAANSNEKAMADWALVLQYSKQDKVKDAAALIATMLKSEQKLISKDLLNMTAARLLYQNGYFEAAIKYYQKIEKKSEYWFDAQEELAWSHVRKGDPQNAIAITTTLAHPAFVGQVGPEPFFIRSLAQLKVCDYPSVVNELQMFPQRFKNRYQELKLISETPAQPHVEQALVQIEEGKSPVVSGKSLPRAIVNDELLRKRLQVKHQLDVEANAAQRLYAKSLESTGLQATFGEIKEKLSRRSESAKQTSLNRIKELATDEVWETKAILEKMHIIEAEVISQVAIAGKLAKSDLGQEKTKLGTTGSQSEDTLRFPGDQEVWFDELSNFKVDIKKGCQKKGTL